MKKKELKNLAKKVADCEYIIQTSNNNYEISKAQDEIMRLSSGVHSFEDLDIMDEMVQELLAKKLEK